VGCHRHCSLPTTQAQLPGEPTATLFPPPQENGSFGFRVAVDADTVVVGAPFRGTAVGQDYGAVAVYHALTGEHVVTLTNPRAAAYGDFGSAIAVSGTRVVVGARSQDTGAAAAGAAYVFDLCSATPTVPVATLNNPSPTASDFFGHSVAISGTRVVVGAMFDDPDGATEAGSAYVYDLASVTPTVPIAILNRPTPVALEMFGSSVAVSGNRVAVGTPGNNRGAEYAGAVYLYDLSSSRPAVPVAMLNNPSPAPFAYFGSSLAVSGNRLVVGAARDDTGAIDAGVAYVFDLGSAAPAVPAVTLTNPSPAAFDSFGSAVAISGSRVVIGAYQEDNGAVVTDPVYVYDLASITPTVPVARFDNPSPAAYDYFGAAVAVSGSRVVIGAYQDDTRGTDAGSAYVFDLGSLTPTVPLATLINPGPQDHRFGTSLAVSGRLMVVGAPGDHLGVPAAGAAYAFDLDSAAPGTPIAAWHDPSPAAYENFGMAVAISGTRVAIGANRNQTSGTVHLFQLASATPTVPILTLTNPNAASGDEFGSALAMSGDRLVVGAHRESAGAVHAGAVYVYDLSSATPAVPRWTLNHPSPTSYASFGISVGIADERVVVGAYQDNTGATFSGRTYVYDLTSAVPSVPRWTLNNPSPAANDKFGYAVAISGQWVLVGAPNDDTDAIASGRAYVYDLASATPTLPRWPLGNPNPAVHAQFGISVALSSNRVVLASRDMTGTDDGSVFIYDLAAAAPTVPLWKLSEPNRGGGNLFGSSIAVSGRRVVIGASQADSVNLNAGAAYAFQTGPRIRLEQPAGTLLREGSASVAFPAVALGGSGHCTFTLRSIGFESLRGLAIALDGPDRGEFSLTSALDASLPAGAATTFTVGFTPAGLGLRTATLHLSNNDPDESPIDVTLTGLGVATGDADGDGLSNVDELNLHQTRPDLADSDGDGIGDGAEVNLAALGFDPHLDSSARLALLQNNALGAGLYRAGDVQNLALGLPLLQRDPTTGRFRLRLGVERSADFSDWSPLTGFTPTHDAATGQIILEFAPDANSAQFYRVFGGIP
jgi:hypothetical protein